jgi:hypothetical protein
MVMALLIVCSALYQDRARASVRQEEARKQRQDAEASQAAQAEVKRQAQIAQDAAGRAAAAKDEAARESENAKARIAEANCLQARDDAIEKATRSQSNARKAVHDCETQFSETLIAFKSVRNRERPWRRQTRAVRVCARSSFACEAYPENVPEVTA